MAAYQDEVLRLAPVARLHERDDECARIDALLRAAREERRSSVLVVRGAAGIGKSALLRHAVAGAGELPVLRATGLESESELAYAGLHQLLLPVSDRLQALPDPQSGALRAAFGVASSALGDRFLVSVAALTLIADIATDQGLLCVVDDAQWLDRPSADALLFIAHRLEAEGVVMLLAARDDAADEFPTPGLPEMRLRPLSASGAAAMLRERSGAEMSDAVCAELVSRSGGYPLALVELPPLLSAEQLSGHSPLVEPFPLGVGMERAFLTRVRTLDPEAQAVLLVAAAEDSGDLHTVQQGAEQLGLDPGLLDDLEASGLLRITGITLEFHHPLVRSAVYRSARSRERRRVHLALADVLERAERPDRRAWHRAVAADAPDAEIASDLEAMAQDARGRGGHAAAAIALERAARLSPGSDERGRRLVAAAEARWMAGHAQHAVALLDQADPLPATARLRGTAALVRGSVELERGSALRAHEVLAAGATHVESSDRRLALNLLALAAEASWTAGNGAWNVELGRRAAQIGHDGDDETELIVEVLAGSARIMQDDFAGGAPRLRRALELADAIDRPRHLILASEAALLLGDNPGAYARCTRAVSELRAAGAVGELPLALQVLASIEAWKGRVASAAVHSDEGHRLGAHIRGSTTLRLGTLAQIDAIRGREADCRDYARQAMEEAEVRGMAIQAAAARWALGRLDLGLGRPANAVMNLLTIAIAGTRASHPLMALLSAPDLIEAAVRSDRRDLAEGALERLDRWAQSTGSSWPLSVAARCHALLREGRAADGLFEEALARHAEQGMPFERARTALLYGEHLRRSHRPRIAREHLRASHGGFEAIGAEPWVRRAAGELRASGEVVRQQQGAGPHDELTSQELQIARLVADGATNREVAAKVFLSPRTVEYHLGKIFSKLGMTSRVELARAVADLPEEPGLGAD